LQTKPLPLSTVATAPQLGISQQFSCSNTSRHQLPVVLKSPSITNCPVVAKSAVSYKFAELCGFFAALLLLFFWVIDWQVCGSCVAVIGCAFFSSTFCFWLPARLTTCKLS